MRGTPLAALLLIFLAAGAPCAADRDPSDITAVVRHLDRLYRSSSSIAELEMNITTPHWQRTLALRAWTEGSRKTFIRILSPLKDRDVATLRLGAEMWNYLPAVNKIIKIPPSMMTGSWMGSDFSNDDLVKESSLLDDYRYRRITPAGAEPELIYIEFMPKEDTPIVWAKIVTALRAEDWLPVSEQFYDEHGAVLRVMTFSDIRDFGGRRLPSVMKMAPANKPGHTTVMRYRSIRFDVPLNADVFTLRNLRGKEQ